jgi:hypothetical protein
MAGPRSSAQLAGVAAVLCSVFLCACGRGSTRATPLSTTSSAPWAHAGDDAEALRAIAAKRDELHATLVGAPDNDAQRATRRRAARYIERALIDEVLPRWDGTPWAFDGHSTTPRTGSIACGYFVTTTLAEAGFRVERAKLAQQPAEAIIKTLVPPEAITRYSDVPFEKFEEAMTSRGDGLYVVGLDNHVGFLIVRGGEVMFHHSSVAPPATVVREQARASVPLVVSRYRVVGKLFTDEALVTAWLDGTAIHTRAPKAAR